jgi:hypothetical protein
MASHAKGVKASQHLAVEQAVLKLASSNSEFRAALISELKSASITPSFTKMRDGDWAVKMSPDSYRRGATIQVPTRSGKTKKVTLGDKIWEGRDRYSGGRVAIVTIVDSSEKQRSKAELTPSFTKMRDGDWAVKMSPDSYRRGATIQVPTRSGKTKKVTLGDKVWEGRDRYSGETVALVRIKGPLTERRAPSRGNRKYLCDECGDYVTPGTRCWETGLQH